MQEIFNDSLLLDGEVWKDVPRFIGKIKTSNKGRIINLNWKNTGKPKLLCPKPDDKTGYLIVSFMYKEKRYSFGIHQLVAQAFIPNPDNLPEVNHKDEDKNNNKVENLEWCTRQYNTNYGTRGKRIRDIERKSVACFKNGQLIKQYDALIDVIQDGFSSGNVSLCCNNKRKYHKGFTWKYVN